MQVRQSHFLDMCPYRNDHQAGSCLHRHGSYHRYAGPEDNQLIWILRFYCKFTGKTISVLPDNLLPYRCVDVSCVEKDFDQRSGVGKPNAPSESSEVLKGCLRRAWRRFTNQSRRQSLCEFFGQRLPLSDTAEELWQAIRLAAGKLSSILLELASQGKSLLGDYRCLSPD